MTSSSGMRWITVFDNITVQPLVVQVAAPGGSGDDGEVVIPLVGHTWSQEALNADLAGGEGPAIGDTIECSYIVERIVGDLSWFPSSFDGLPLFWLIRTGFIVYASDGDLGVTPLSLVGINGQSPLTGDLIHDDLEGPWMYMDQWAGLNSLNEEGIPAGAMPVAYQNGNVLRTTHYDIKVNRRIGPMDVLCFQVWAGVLGGSGVTPVADNVDVRAWGQMRALVRKLD